MVELGELEAHAGEFAKRNTQVVVISLEDQTESQASQQDFPHLVVVADTERKLSEALEVIHPGAGPGGADTLAPTTIVVDGSGGIRWTYRPDRHIVRLPVKRLLAVLDENVPIQSDAIQEARP